MKYPATRQCPSASRVGVIVSVAANRLTNDERNVMTTY
jgi:hypothetical protein